jgi:alpha-2-macroglobulin
VYASVLVFKPGSNTEFITPKRALGMVHIPMDRSQRGLQVKLTAPEKMQPESELAVTVQAPELKGQAAMVSLHAVDQGITNITRFSVPDPFKHFFARRAFSLDLFDVYGRVIESVKGEAARFRFGGDAALMQLPQAERRTAKVQTVDLYSGQVQLDAQGQAVIKLKVPEFNGSLKLSAVVYGSERYGLAQQDTIVRAPIVVEASLPRVMAPGDSSRLTLDVQNFTGKAGSFTVKASGGAELIIADGASSIELADQEKKTVSFNLRAGAMGVAPLTVSLSGNGANFKRTFETVVRAAWNEERLVRFDSFDNVSNIDLSVDSSRFLPDTVRSRVSLSTRAPIPVADAASGLFEYPYGCIEQTSSKLLAYVLLDDATLKKLGLDPQDAKKRNAAVSAGLGRLASMQNESGDFNYWPGDSYSDPMFTPLVAEILLIAQRQGHELPPGVLQKTLERMKSTLLSGGEANYDRVSQGNYDHLKLVYNAHAAWVLAQVKQAPLGTLRTLFDNSRVHAMSPLPLVRLGMALQAAGDQKRADQAFAEAFGPRWSYPTDKWLGDYGSSVRDHSLALSLAVEGKVKLPSFEDKLLELAQTVRNKGQYFSTQERAAFVHLAGALAQGGKPLKGSLNVGDIKEEFDAPSLYSTDLANADLRAGASLQVDPQRLYLLQYTAGIPKQAPAADSSKVEIRRDYFKLDGTAWDGSALNEGDQLVVRLRIVAKEWLPDALVVELAPGGLEVENLNLVPNEQLQSIKIDGLDVGSMREALMRRTEEFRDDRYVLALNLQATETTTFYLLRAVSPGTFVNPPPYVEDMYRAEVRGIGEAKPASITVK